MSIFTRHSNISPGPWQSRKCDKGNSHEIIDGYGKLIARVPYPQVVTNVQEFTANLAVMSTAPELLAALREAAYHLDKAGVPLNQEFYDLINRASVTMQPIPGPRNTPPAE